MWRNKYLRYVDWCFHDLYCPCMSWWRWIKERARMQNDFQEWGWSFREYITMLDFFKRLVDDDPEGRNCKRCEHHATYHQLKLGEPKPCPHTHRMKKMRLHYKKCDCVKFWWNSYLPFKQWVWLDPWLVYVKMTMGTCGFVIIIFQ
jgi:hypothetical protein